ncbi:MAG: hypothetical protein AAGA45_02560 [Verrucomicrobiota bacterium]
MKSLALIINKSITGISMNKAVLSISLIICVFSHAANLPELEKQGSSWRIVFDTESDLAYQLEHKSSLSDAWTQEAEKRGTGAVFQDLVNSGGQNTVFVRYRIFEPEVPRHITADDQSLLDDALAGVPDISEATMLVTSQDEGTWTVSETQLTQGVQVTITLNGTWAYSYDPNDLYGFDLDLTITQYVISIPGNPTQFYSPSALAQAFGSPQVAIIEMDGFKNAQDQLDYRGNYIYSNGTTEPIPLN